MRAHDCWMSSNSSSIEAACAGTLAGFKQPREIRLVEELPRSTLEKINKAQLRRMLEAD